MAQTPKLPPLPTEHIRAAEEFQNRKKYGSFDLETLRAIKDEHLEQALLDYVFGKLSANSGRYRQIIEDLSPEFRAFYLTWLVEAEVLNGGFNQFFWNPSCEFAELVPAALRAIGDDEAAEIMQRALETAIDEIPSVAKFRRIGTLQAFSDSYRHTKLDEFDIPFSKRAEHFRALRLRYVRLREHAFVTP